MKTPGKLSDYRPIACCSVFYKCISEIIVNRIRDHLDEIVSVNQSAFVLGRLILDNILLSQELVRGYHRNRGVPRCALKVDLMKAYDTVDWDFLKYIIDYVGFHPVMVHWIMLCVSSASFTININGDLNGFFQGRR